MIDETSLDRMAEALDGRLDGSAELIRLARLGLWTERYGVPALKTAHEKACTCCNSSEEVEEHCSKALAELPR